MIYEITLSDPDRDHWILQAETGSALRKAGFTKLKWQMGSMKPAGNSLHTWRCYGDSESVMMLKLSADVEKIEEIG